MAETCFNALSPATQPEALAAESDVRSRLQGRRSGVMQDAPEITNDFDARIVRTTRATIAQSRELLRDSAHLVSPPYERPSGKHDKLVARPTEQTHKASH